MNIAAGISTISDNLGFALLSLSCVILLLIGILAILLNARRRGAGRLNKLDRGEKILLAFAVFGIMLYSIVIFILLTREAVNY